MRPGPSLALCARLLKTTDMPRCVSLLRHTGLSHRAYSVWARLYAIGYQPYANDRRPAFEIFLSHSPSKLFITLVLALCAGCAGIERSYPDKRYFVLEVPSNPTESNPVASGTLQVSAIRVSPRYADRGFVYRTSEAGYESDFYNQFLVSPASLITEEVHKDLAASEVFKHVIGASNQSQPGYVLEGTVNALYGDFRNPDSPKAVLEMEFFLTSEIPAKPGILMQKRYSKSIPLNGRTAEALVKGWNQALEEILSSLVADLKVVIGKIPDSRAEFLK